MGGALELAGLVRAVFQYIGGKEATKYVDECVEIEETILKERALGPKRDDAKLEFCLKRLKIMKEAASNALAARQAGK